MYMRGKRGEERAIEEFISANVSPIKEFSVRFSQFKELPETLKFIMYPDATPFDKLNSSHRGLPQPEKHGKGYETKKVWEPLSYTKAFGDGPRNFEPWSSNEEDTSADKPSHNFYTTPTGGRLRINIFNVHRPHLHGGSSVALGSNSQHAHHESMTLTKGYRSHYKPIGVSEN
ncbi:hypothetical protein TNCV_2548511 [Trichonephila clavipes]|nr:hypothetical protein TNCV_2548511 [Trichonephila clavipes]